MDQRERAHDEVDLVVRQRQVVQVADAEIRARDLRARDREHLGRAVDADHRVTEPREVCGVAPGPARGIERDADRKVAMFPSVLRR